MKHWWTANLNNQCALAQWVPGVELQLEREGHLRNQLNPASHVSSILVHSQRGSPPPPLRRLSRVKRHKERTVLINIWSTFTWNLWSFCNNAKTLSSSYPVFLVCFSWLHLKLVPPQTHVAHSFFFLLNLCSVFRYACPVFFFFAVSADFCRMK